MKNSRHILLLALIFWLSACVRTNVAGGNGEAYNGGDANNVVVAATRARLLAGAVKAARFAPETVCQPVLCQGTSSRWCDVVNSFSPEQRGECQNFFSAQLSAISQLHTGTQPVPLLVTAERLYVSEPDGQREVDAKTRLGTEGEIVFSQASVERLDSDALLAVLFHESGHKLNLMISDQPPYGHFASGRDFLDSMACAFVVIAKSNESVGHFLVGSRRYYSNGQSFCEFLNLPHWLSTGGPAGEAELIRLTQLVPTWFDAGTCSYRGFFSVNGTGYYANTAGRYCSFRSFSEWRLAGGPANEADILTYPNIPSTMVSEGFCQP